jgi:predicted ATPase
MRPASTLVRRSGPLAEKRRDAGHGFDVLTKALPSYRSVLAEFADPGRVAELAAVRERLRSWRFHDGFRVDADAPSRRPQVGTRTPVLADDGADLAAAIQTIIEAGAGSGAAELHNAVAVAFEGASLSVSATDGLFDVHLHQPGMRRPLRAAELSDGTLRFLLWAAALLGPQLPTLMVLNEPETSLHAALIKPLSAMIRAACANTQVVVVTHSATLTDGLAADAIHVELTKDNGETRIHGQSLTDTPPWHWGSR